MCRIGSGVRVSASFKNILAQFYPTAAKRIVMTRGCIRGFFLGGWGFCPGWFCRGVLSGVLTGVILSGVLSAVVLSGFCPGGGAF